MGKEGMMTTDPRHPSLLEAAANRPPSDGQNALSAPTDMEESLPPQPVQLFSIGDDPCVRHLHVCCRDQVGMLFKMCELLTSNGIDIRRAEIKTTNGIVSNHFDLHASRPSHFADATDWCQELEEFIAGSSDDGHPAGHAAQLEGSLVAVSKHLSVNPDLLSVVCFTQILNHEGPPNELRYRLELEGINQAGLLTYACFVFVRSGFSVVGATISTTDGHFSDMFELTTSSNEAEQKLRSYLVVPTLLSGGYSISLPFHATKSDLDLAGFMRDLGPGSPRSPKGSQHSLSTLYPSPGNHSPRVISSASAPPGHDLVVQNWTFEVDDVITDLKVSKSMGSKAVPGPAKVPGLAKVPVPRSLGSRGRADSGSSALGSRGRADSGSSALPEVPEDSPRNSPRSSQRSSPRNSPRSHAASSTLNQTSINFGNGDVYEGQSHVFEDGEKRHGFGSYTYSNSHETYKQYQGQWQEDKKHGHGVLFFRNGGVYAGQWKNNIKHGLGVLLETQNQGNNDNAQNVMPQFRYEGQWEEDMPHGLGVQENEKSTFFGRFGGTQPGLGVHMHLNKTGTMCCEFVDGDDRVPLDEALLIEMARLQNARLGADTPPELSSMTYHFGTSNGSQVRPSLASLVFEDSGSGTHTGSPGGSSGNNSGSAVTANGSTPQDRPAQGARQHAPFRPEVRSPQETLRTPKLTAGSRSWGPVLTPTEHFLQRRAASGGSISSMAGALLDSPPSPGAMPDKEVEFTLNIGTDTDVAFSLSEENNLLSPVPKDDFENGNTEQPGDLSRCQVPSTSSSPRRPSSKVERRQVRISPLLWSEDELAAYFACLGISSSICERVMTQRLKGAAQLLEMSNSEMRRQFGLVTPVERLVVRESLKRLLDADRWENKVRGYRAGDLLSDSVLGEFLVPAQEMKLVDHISHGGYGTVYRGVYTPKSDRCGLQAGQDYQVAVKEMKGERRVRLYELLKEACVMASLKHPNICTFIGVCVDTTGRKHCIVSQLMDGSLFDLIHQPYKLHWNGDLTVKMVVDISKGICAGIAYLHMMSLVHADLKSSNILMDVSSSKKLVPRICDFGHAAVRSFPAPHHRCGTPHWAAPEVLRGEALGPEADIYSFGVLLWEMLAQRLPHKGLSFGQVLAAVGWAGWTPDFKQLPDIPRELYRILKSCFSFLPQDRPNSKNLQEQLRRMAKQANLKARLMLSAFFS